MFDRIDVDVIDVTFEIGLVANGMLPVPALQMPRSPLAARLPEIRSPAGRLRENTDLISRQRVAKLASPSGSVHTALR